jgi:hypothetical protein
MGNNSYNRLETTAWTLPVTKGLFQMMCIRDRVWSHTLRQARQRTVRQFDEVLSTIFTSGFAGRFFMTLLYKGCREI